MACFRCITMLAVTLALTATTYAQKGEAPKGDIFGGYSFVSVDNDLGRAQGHGFAFSGAGHVNDWFGIAGEVTGHYKDGDSLYYVMGGPRVTYRSENNPVEPFAHVLFGGGFTDDVNRFSMAVGGGMDFRVNEHFGIRAVQVDYTPIFYEGSTAHNYRISTGIQFRF